LIKVSSPTFAQPARRNLLAPVLIAFLLLGVLLAFVIRATASKTADLTITRTLIYPTHTIFKSDSTLVGHGQSQDDLYVLTTLRIDDRLHLPLFLKDFTASLTTADGQEFTTSATEKQDLDNVYTSFPAIRPLASEPLLRETMIAPGQSAQGMLLLHFPVTKTIWDHRRNATLNIDLYHQGQQGILISRASEAIPNAAKTPEAGDPNESTN
jgi:hypothetical protein